MDSLNGAGFSSEELENKGESGVVVENLQSNCEEVNVSSDVNSREMDIKMESRVSVEVGSGEMDMKMESRVSSEVDSSEMDGKIESEIKVEEVKGNEGFAVRDSQVGELIGIEGEEAKISSEEMKKDVEMMEKPSISDFYLAYSMVDEGYAARMSEAFGSEAAKAQTYGYEPGDMVWGRVKSHPWWPGHIYSEAFASSSVRRTKREGHVLVAFFGDSSYGWFDPAELIPFDPHYHEKSRQSNSRNFTKAVEEAVDEARRRAALGLTCYCRNPFNFRPSNFQGYYAVDVSGYERGLLYSLNQIKTARDNFQPGEALSFVQQLAMNPRDCDQKDISTIKNVAMFLSLRKATFEEFDETYSQAFGMPASRPNHEAVGMLDQPGKLQSRAPLSGRMVMAEALGEMKSSPKPSKVKDKPKKDKYVLKRREKPSEPKVNHLSSHAGNVSSAYMEGPTTMAPGDYIFQKRTSVQIKPQVLLEQEEIQNKSGGDPALTLGETSQESETMGKNLEFSKVSAVDAQINTNCIDLPAASAIGSPLIQPVANSSISVSLELPEGGSPPLDVDMNVLHEMTGRMTPTRDVGPISTSLERLEVPQESTVVDSKQEGAKPSAMSKGLEQSKQLLKETCAKKLDKPVKKAKAKAKALQHPENLGSEKTGTMEKKKKKKRKLESDTLQDHPHKLLRTVKDGESVKKSAGNSIGTPPEVDLANIKVELPQLVQDLLTLALDPFHGVERNGPAIVRHVLLQFRSLVYQKSLVSSPVTASEMSNLSDNKSPSGSAPAKIPSGVGTKEPPSKLKKALERPDDPTKAGRKRNLSERQEEKSAKRLKKLNEVKSLINEKKVGTPKIPEPKQEQKEAGVTAPPKLNRPDPVKKPEQLAKAAEPGMLVLRFPPRTTLPSVPELKARFARFGPLDHSALRVFWKSSQCRVVFKHKSHAFAAYNYAVRNNALFGQVRVNYQVRDVVVSGAAADVPGSMKRQVDDASDEVPSSSRHGADSTDYLGDLPKLAPIPRRPQQPAVQLKSCLKKPSGEETGSAMDAGAPRENTRVRFKLGGDESDSRREEMMVNTTSNNNNNNIKNIYSSTADNGGSLSSSHAMDDVNSRKFQKVIPPQTQQFPHILSSLNNQQQQQQQQQRSSLVDVNESHINGIGHFSKSSSSPYLHHPHHPQYNQVVQEEQKNINNILHHPPTINNNSNRIDISSQMLSLLMRCNDIVMDVSSSLSYVPYHPL